MLLNIFIIFIEHKSLIIKNYDGETKEFSELLDKLEKKHMCNRYYCYFCLKGSYDTLAENIKDNNAWLCPYCTGTCYCTRCMRNEKILQLIAYYFSINGDINYLYNELVNMNSIIDELFTNFVLNNIYLILYDKNLTPTQMVNNFINYDLNKLNDIQNKEDEINSLKDYIEILNKQKKEMHKEFETYYKDKYEVKNKFNLISDKDIKNNNHDKDINNIDMINNNNYFNYKNEELKEEEEETKPIIKIKKIEKEENILKYQNEKTEINDNKYEKDGIKTRKKNKVIYFKDKYYNRKKDKKIVRKNEKLLIFISISSLLSSSFILFPLIILYFCLTSNLSLQKVANSLCISSLCLFRIWI